MAVTLREIANDIAVAMGFSHDDSDRWLFPISYNVQLAINKLKDQDLVKNAKGSGDARESSSMLSTFVVPVTYTQDPGDSAWSHHSFQLPRGVYSLPFGKEINFVRYHRPSLPTDCRPSVARATFTHTTIASLSALYESEYQKPSPEKPYFAREGDSTVHIFGVDPAVDKLTVGIFAAPDLTEIGPDDPLDIAPEKLFDIKRMVMQTEAWVLQIPRERLQSDGRDFDPGQIVRTSPIISINDPSLTGAPQQ